MAVLDRETTITKDIQRVVKTGAANEATLVNKSCAEQEKEQERIDQWEKVIDRSIEWGRSPSHIDEDEWESPSKEACANACKLATTLRDNCDLPPDRVVPTGDGGIVLEHKRDKDAFVYEVAADGMVEYFAFHDSRLISRCEIDVH